ncbi:hypothetical protein PR202_gb23293 [Eleusine coracana subsp. coracana]|uniref:Uncharacterized protein n=1 Tax=Eleusine coracana subsp. coracana TaxID=191504 RepID=A0AAV5FIQ8_ELECO|nr:hypothetical protein PR202_gb23293 [Eleusine coracana subsp. coracana]
MRHIYQLLIELLASQKRRLQLEAIAINRLTVAQERVIARTSFMPASISQLERQVDLLPAVPGEAEPSAAAVSSCCRPTAHAVDAQRRRRRQHVLLRRSRGGAERRRRERPEFPAGVDVRHGGRVDEGRRRRPDGRRRGGGDVAAALGEGALELVRVLVAAQRLRAVELAVAVVAGEGVGAVVAGGDGDGGGGTPAGREVQAQVEVDARSVGGRLVHLHRSEEEGREQRSLARQRVLGGYKLQRSQEPGSN